MHGFCTRLFLTVVSLLTGATVALATGLEGASIVPKGCRPMPASDPAPWEKLIPRFASGVPGDSEVHNRIDVRFGVSKGGNVQEIQFEQSSGVFDFDFNCICAILGSFPLSKDLPAEARKQYLMLGSGDVGREDSVRKALTAGRMNFRAKTNLHKDRYLCCNIIPVSILTRYPQRFTTDEICSQSNVRAIAKSFFEAHNAPTVKDVLANKRFRSFYQQWNVFFAEHPQANKEEIEKVRDGLDREYSDMFVTSKPVSEKR